MKKVLFWGALLLGVVALGFYAMSKFNPDLSLPNAARALVNQSAQEMLNAPENMMNKMKDFVPDDISNTVTDVKENITNIQDVKIQEQAVHVVETVKAIPRSTPTQLKPVPTIVATPAPTPKKIIQEVVQTVVPVPAVQNVVNTISPF